MHKNNITTNAIVLKRTNYKDADKIITVYSDKLGKIKLIAKGIRKMTSRKRGHLELLNHTKIEIIYHNSWYIVTQAELHESFSNIKNDFEKTRWAYYILETFDKMVPEDEESPLLYNFLLKILKTFDETEINPKHLINAYNLKLIKILGYYSIGERKIVDNEVNDYYNKLISSKFEDVKNIEASESTINKAHLLILANTEEIIEREIKSLKAF